MTFSVVSASVSSAAYLTTFNTQTTHAKNETSSEAVNIGNLDEQSTNISLSEAGYNATTATSATFTTSGQGYLNLTASFATGQGAQIQLYDSSGNLVADSEGTGAQLAAYTQWTQGDLSVAGGQYTVTVTPPAATDSTTNTSTGSISISTSEQQGSTLGVASQLTGSDSSEYYNFSFSGTDLKLDFNATTNGSDARVIVYNSTGGIVADSKGTSYERAQYAALTSGTGLTASTGNYTAEVTYANGIDPTKENINYSLNLYSGQSYAVSYQNKVTAHATDTTAAGSVTPTSTAQLYTRSAFNKINATAAAAVNIGWLQQDKSALDVYSQLTSADSADYYSFTLQQGNNLKFGFNTSTTPNPSQLRVQLYDASGVNLLADSGGTPAQQAAYKALTTTNGLAAQAGTYIAKISYVAGATKTNQAYEFGIYSGTSYATQYKTTASPQTEGNALLSGTLTSSSRSTALATYLTAAANGDTTSSLSTALTARI